MNWNNNKDYGKGSIGLDRMIELEKYTDYEFSNTDKATAFINDTDTIVDKKIETASNYIKIGAISIYIPLILISIGFFLFNINKFLRIIK